jgi:hypothetical protein
VETRAGVGGEQEIRSCGSVVHDWMPGSWNAISDCGSRVAEAEPAAVLADDH